MTQKEALDILKTGRNVFLTGAAGSGKTHVLREYIAYLKDLDANIGITASTGIAATHMGGTTIHSWSGIGIRDSLSKSEIKEIAEKRQVRKTVQDASVLIIDEISMLHHFRLDLIDSVIREVKNCNESFGGMQVVFCGDFFQLPPVRKAGGPETLFAYHSETWKNLNLKICYLSEQHRQNDLDYLKILNAVRESSVSEEIIETLKTRFHQNIPTEPTKLYSHNRDVNSENENELNKIPGKTFEYEMREMGRQSIIKSLKKSCLAPETLKLKVGAKVMFVKNNFEQGYVNGTLGTVIKCGYEEITVQTFSGKTIDVERETWVIEEDGKIKAEINQYPLRLAWAITVHKSQGMSLDSALIDLSRSFERGMGYVALSRVRSLEGLFLKGFNYMALQINEEVLEQDKKFKEYSKTNSFHIRTMGEKKLSQMHQEFAKKIKGVRSAKATRNKEKTTVEQTKDLLDEGKGLKEIAKIRGLKLGTILDHIEQIKKQDNNYNIYNLRNSITKNKFKEIYNAFRKNGISEGGVYHLAPVKNLLGPKYSYDDLRLVRLFL
ncbi:MAG: AAA family ATPase [Parcubacteria group bacterium]|jgi:ATP-dependent exoDNAse (exonuclease V) alpha subunit|nr:AAA family ATPase [Parcubacteria group bacterium]